MWYYQQSGIPAIEITKDGAAEQLGCEEEEATRRRPQVWDLSNCHRCALHVLALFTALCLFRFVRSFRITTIPLFCCLCSHLFIYHCCVFDCLIYTTPVHVPYTSKVFFLYFTLTKMQIYRYQVLEKFRIFLQISRHGFISPEHAPSVSVFLHVVLASTL